MRLFWQSAPMRTRGMVLAMVSSITAIGHCRCTGVEVERHAHQAPVATPDRCNGACIGRLWGRAERLLLRSTSVPPASRNSGPAGGGVRSRTLGLERLRVGLATWVLDGPDSSARRPDTSATWAGASGTCYTRAAFGSMRQMVSAAVAVSLVVLILGVCLGVEGRHFQQGARAVLASAPRSRSPAAEPSRPIAGGA